MSSQQTGADANRQADDAPQPPASTSPTTLSQVWSVIGTVVAPATMVSALLFYFGYVSARAQFAYFGVDVDTLGYGTQEFVMRASQPLLVPALVLLIGTAGLTWVNSSIHQRMRTATTPSVRRTLTSIRAIAGALLAGGLVMLVAYPSMGSWGLYPLVTPAVLGIGAGLLALVDVGGTPAQPPPHDQRPARPGGRRDHLLGDRNHRAMVRNGPSQVACARPHRLPAVVIDTSQALVPRDEHRRGDHPAGRGRTDLPLPVPGLHVSSPKATDGCSSSRRHGPAPDRRS